MKRLYVAMLLFCVGAYAAPVLSAELFVRSLPVEVVAPMRGESDNFWDLSNVISERTFGVDYRVYGDSLLSEEYDRIRCWYDTDSCGMLRMEGLLWRLDPVRHVLAGCWRGVGLDSGDSFMAIVERESMPRDTLSCRLERKADEGGLLILPGPDTVAVVMRRELVGVTDMAGEYLQECRRWFHVGDRRRCALPVAVALTRSYGGKLLSDVAFVADSREYVSEEYEREEQPDLSLLDVGFDGGILTIASGGGAMPYDVRADVTDLAGRSYLGGVLPAGHSSLSLNFSALPHGAYLVVLSCRESVRKEPFVW